MPAPSTGMPADCAQHCGTYVWSGNWAAVVGAVLCVVLLFAWIHVASHDEEEDDGC